MEFFFKTSVITQDKGEESYNHIKKLSPKSTIDERYNKIFYERKTNSLRKNVNWSIAIK